jgi:hypothetical protein
MATPKFVNFANWNICADGSDSENRKFSEEFFIESTDACWNLGDQIPNYNLKGSREPERLSAPRRAITGRGFFFFFFTASTVSSCI